MQEYQNKKNIGQCLSSAYLFEKHQKQQQQQNTMCFSISVLTNRANVLKKVYEELRLFKNLGIIWMYKYWIGLYY